MQRVRFPVTGAVLAFLLLVILWKGGKALDAVWLTALLAGFVTVFDRDFRLAVPRAFFLTLLAFAAWTAVSFLFSRARNYGFDEVIQTASLILLTLWAASERQRNSGFAERFFQTISVALLLACAIGTMIYIFQPVSRFVGTFFDYRFHTDYWPNAWAEFVLLAWPMLLWTLWTRENKKLEPMLRPDWVRSAVLGLVFGCLLLSYSRGGILAFAGQGILLWILVAFVRPSLPWRKIGVQGLIVVAAAAAMFLGTNAVRSGLYDIESVLRKATFSAAEGTSSVSERSQFWDQAVRMTKQSPVLGYGPYSFRFVQPHAQQEVLATSDHAHNVFLKYASERGLAAAALFAVLLAWAMISGAFRVLRERGRMVPMDLMLMVSVAGVTAHNLIDFNLQFAGIAMPLYLTLGLLASGSGWKDRHGVLVMRIVACVLVVFTMFEGMNLFLSSRARRNEARGDFIAALGWYSLADRSLFPRDAGLAEGAMLLGLQQLPQAEHAVTTYLTQNEQDARAWRLLGDIYLRWNKRPEALRAYEKAYTYGRYNDLGITRGLVYLLKEQDRRELESRKHEFDELLHAFGLAIENNTHFITLGKNVEELVSLTELLSEEFPADADLYRALARRAVDNANEERTKTASRPRGLLW